MRKAKPAISVDINENGHSLGDFYGIFFEDINHSADGGLYAQMVQNYSFEFCEKDNRSYNSMTGWEPVGKADIRTRTLGGFFAKNPCFADIAAESGDGIRNLGYAGGMSFKAELGYRLSFFAKGAVEITTALEAEDGSVLAEETFVLTDEWQKYSVTLVPSRDADGGRLGFRLKQSGRIGLDAVMLFPSDAVCGLFRKDLFDALKALTPKFMRFPGGCLVHDGDLNPESRTACYCWKNTLGAPEARPSKRNNWGYNQSLGLGYYEYFILCEELGCEPLPVLPAGWNPHRGEACPLYEMQPWVDDALDLIEFANGTADSRWGKVRAQLGHPKPFRLKYLAIGNEEVGVEFPPRFEIIANAVKEKYPKIKLIHSAGPFPAGSEYERGCAAAKAVGAELIDEHYYASPRWLLANIDRYNDFPTRKPKVFLGEYASKDNKMFNALAEAAYMTGLENNAHAVSLACYAPLLCNINYKNWVPDMIFFDNRRVCKTPSYYVQQLFANNLGDCLVPVQTKGLSPAPAPELPISGLVELVGDGASGMVRDVKITNLQNGDEVSFGDIELTADGRHTLSDVNLSHFELRFKFTKTGGRADRGIRILFGKADEKNLLCWEFGGWQNQDCIISSTADGMSTCLDQHIFIVNSNYEYDMCLHVENRTITTIVDGAVMNRCTDKIPEIYPLYVTASKLKKTGELIIKAANVTASPVNAKLTLGRGGWRGEAYTLKGLPDAENTLDNEVVSTVSEPFALKSGGEVEFPPYSVRVLRLKLANA